MPMSTSYELAGRTRQKQRTRIAMGAAARDPGFPIWVGAALLELLGSMQTSGGPVLLLVDDAQWADRPSLQALLFALRRLQADRVLTLMVSPSVSTRCPLAGFQRLVAHRPGGAVRGRASSRGGLPPVAPVSGRGLWDLPVRRTRHAR
mgnify:CR=1 FL=1